MEEQKPRITAAILVEHEGKFLLGKRNKENAKDFWIIPGGGVEFGEKIEDAAVREIKEETNLDVEITRFIGFNEVINVPGKYHSVIFFFLAKPVHTEISASEDISKAEFFTLEEIKKLNILPSVEWALRKAGIWK
ncbi:MAG: NUDIX hydrolase [Candidatus Nanoarchaeia archaeon]